MSTKHTNLIVSSSPHVCDPVDTKTIMRDVVIALIPALAVSVYVFGIRALIMVAVCVAASVLFEAACRKLLNRPQTIGDWSAVVTGVILAFNLPVSLPYWMAVIGCFVAIVVVKQLFGGLGQNFANPAIVGRIVLFIAFATPMTNWVVTDRMSSVIREAAGADAVTGATPLGLLNKGIEVPVKDMALGLINGSLGEVSALCLLIGGAYLLWRKVISWQTPVSYIATVAVLTLLFPKAGSGVEWMLYSVFGGGLMLGAIFMATDYATSPVTGKGQLIYGIGCGVFTVFIRYFGSYNEGVCYSIMVMNLFVALIDKYVKPTRFGVVKSNEKEAAKK